MPLQQVTPVKSSSAISLSGQTWQFRACGGDAALLRAHAEVTNWMPACVPGSTHGQLFAQKKIPDPYHDRNELDLQWIDQLDWEFRCHVDVGADVCDRARQELVCEGLDSVATVRVNGTVVGRSVNMFRQVVCDLRGVLKTGRNEVVVFLASPTAHGAAEVAANATHMVSQSPLLRGNREFAWQTGERRLTNRPWIRKVQCHFGWDWGVCLPTQGLWRDARLETADTPRIVSLRVAQRHEGAPGAPKRVHLTVSVDLSHVAPAVGVVVVTCAGVAARVPVTLPPSGAATATVTLVIASPRLWWPNGYGSQPLYDLSAQWEGGGAPCHRRIGLRTLAVETVADQTPEGRPAESLTVVVNGRPLFAKGGNWIPPDQFVERCTPAVYRHLLESMTAAHMNMVRVWGGGWYELDVFYDLCDELGLLVWQDFMMACALYPDTQAFIAEITAEARDQVRRLQHHACVALWCGDNEVLTGVNHWWKGTDAAADILKGYTRLMQALRATVNEVDPTRHFRVSSPSNGWIDPESESPDRGDVHYWAVWHGRQPFSNYLTVRPRFCSEFGFQAFAEPRTMRACVPPEGLNPSSWQMEHHQRSPDGNQMIANAIARELPLPRDFDAYCWESQINQACAIRTAVEHWRRLKPWCGGTLYWQINDLWPVASWSSIDWHGRWKALHHAATRFFAPLLLSLTHEPGSDDVGVWVTSDVDRPLRLKGALLAVTWDGRVVGRVTIKAEIAADASREVATVKVRRLLGSLAAPRDVCLFAEVAGSGWRTGAHLALVPWKHVALPRPRFTKSLVKTPRGLELCLTTNRVAAFVHAEIADSESHFAGSFDVLRPGVTYRWPLVEHGARGQAPLRVSDARKRLRVFSLYDLAWRDAAL